MDLALKADAFFVRMESEKAAGSAATSADASRLRVVLEGGRAFEMGGDAETGAGLELGGGASYTNPSSGLSVEAKVRMLLAHADSGTRSGGRARRHGSTGARAAGASRSRSLRRSAPRRAPRTGCGGRGMRARSRRTAESSRRRAVSPPSTA